MHRSLIASVEINVKMLCDYSSWLEMICNISQTMNGDNDVCTYDIVGGPFSD